MKTCDVCKRTDLEVHDDVLKSVLIGTSIGVMTVGVTNECPVECELCSDCILKVNDAIAGHLQATFGLRIRR